MRSIRHCVEVSHRGQTIRTLVLRERPLELGRAESCDVVIPDLSLRPRAAVLVGKAQKVFLRRVHADGRLGEPLELHEGRSLPLSADYHVRVAESAPRPMSEELVITDAVKMPELRSETLTLVVGAGAQRVRRKISHRPISVGSASDNDVVLSDRAVSRHHCRFEPLADGCLVRDLGSRNGTWMAGLRVGAAGVPIGTRLRVGRTPMMVASESVEVEGGAFIASSPLMARAVAEARRAGALPWPVLIHGESGAGKEGIARMIHDAGRGGPWVAANAGGLPEQILETELFGHERGAFTGAERQHRGYFERASGGTLFLDEVGELSLRSQAQLLRVLETWRVRRVGGETEIPVDVRLVCATHRDLHAMVAEGSFRLDLYYRLARLVVEVPPLRERPEDVLALAEHFLRELTVHLGPRRLGRDARTLLLGHHWPGNARELRNVVSAAAAYSPDGVVDASALLPAMRQLSGAAPIEPAAMNAADVVAAHAGNLSAAARALGVPRSTLRGRLRAALASNPPAAPRADGELRLGPGLIKATSTRDRAQRMTKPA